MSMVTMFSSKKRVYIRMLVNIPLEQIAAEFSDNLVKGLANVDNEAHDTETLLQDVV